MREKNTITKKKALYVPTTYFKNFMTNIYYSANFIHIDIMEKYKIEYEMFRVKKK